MKKFINMKSDYNDQNIQEKVMKREKLKYYCGLKQPYALECVYIGKTNCVKKIKNLILNFL